MTPTKDQIEAEITEILKNLIDFSWQVKAQYPDCKLDEPEIEAHIMIASSEMEKLKEQWQREAWLESSKAGGCHACLDNWIREQGK